MNYFTLFALAILTFGLIQDYKKDKGQNIKAKVLQAVCLTILIASYAGSFRILGALIRNFDKAKERFSVDVGLVPGQLHFIFYLLHATLAMTVIILAYQMIRRNDKSRRWLIILLPFVTLLEVFSFYRGWVTNSGDLELNHSMILLIGFLLVAGLASIIVAIYKSKSIITFFTTIEPNPLQTTEENGVTQ
ncbi:MAG: hypothetical protein HYZ44_18330 [Bacteroidetes bacterium]|nr:hypothetical protein [Bacteroidota bacterium]